MYPRWAKNFTRASKKYRSNGLWVPANVPTFEPGKFNNGLHVSEGTQNHFPADMSQNFTAPWTSGTLNGTYTVSIRAGTGQLTLSGGATGTVTVGNSLTFTVSNATVTFTPSGGTPQRSQLEAKAYATPWHLGGQTREPDSHYYTLPAPLPAEWFLSGFVKPDQASTLSRTTDMMLATLWYDANNLYVLQFRPSTGVLRLYKRYGGTLVTLSSVAISYPAGAMVAYGIGQLTAAHNDLVAGMHLYYRINSGAVVHVNNTDVNLPTPPTKLYVGCYASAGFECNGVIDALHPIDIQAEAASGTSINNAWVESLLTATSPPTPRPGTILLANFDDELDDCLPLHVDDEGMLQPLNAHVLRDSRHEGLPRIREYTDEIPGRHGELRFGADLAARTFDLHCAKEALRAEQMAEIRNIASQLDPTLGERVLTFADEPGWRYRVVPADRMDVRRHATFLEFTIPFKMPEPFAEAVTESSLIGSGSITNNGSVECPLRIEIYGPVTNPSVVVGSSTLTWTGTVGSEQILTIDTGRMTVTLDGSNALSGYSGGFPQLPPGITQVTAASGGTTVFYWRERWL